MKKALALLFSLWATLACAQGDGPANSIPVFAGPGIIGFGNVGPCANQVLGWSGGSIASCVSAAVTSANNIWTGQQYFTGGIPWCDVVGQGASPTGSNDAGIAINQCVAKLQVASPSCGTGGVQGGIVFFPPGFYAATHFNPPSSTGLCPIHFVGSGRGVTTLQMTDNAIALKLDSPNSSVRNMAIVGTNQVGAGNPSLSLTPNCVGCLVSFASVNGGTDMNVQGTDSTLFDVTVGNTYGGAELYVRSTVHMIRVATDHGYPVLTPTAPLTVPNWAVNVCSGSCPVGKIVISGGWYIQTPNGGVTANPAPVITSTTAYGQTITDGGGVQWNLVSPVGMCGTQFDTGATGIDDTHGDHSGAYDYGVCITDNFSGGPGTVGSITMSGGATFSAITSAIHVVTGNNIIVSDFDMGTVLSTGTGIDTSANFAGPLSVDNGHIINVSTGVFLNAGTNITISNVTVLPGSFTNVTGVRATNAVNGVAIHDNKFNLSPIAGFGVVATGVVVDSGAHDYIHVWGNTCDGVTVTCVNNAASGVHQTFEQAGQAMWGAPSSKNVLINPQATAAVVVSGVVSAFQHSANGTSNLTVTQLSDNSGEVLLSGAFPLKIGVNGSTTDLMVGSNHAVGVNTNPTVSGIQLDVNNNATGTGSTAETTLGPVRLTMADTTAGGYTVQAFGGNPSNAFARADGTASSPTAMAATETIGALSFLPWNGTAYGTRGQYRCQTSELQSGSAGGTYCDILTTIPTTTSLGTTFRTHGDGHNLDIFSGAAPTISTCGTTPSISGNDMNGVITAGSGALTSCVVNFAKTWGTAPQCTFSSPTAIASPTVNASTTQLTIGGTSLTSLVLNYICRSFGSS